MTSMNPAKLVLVLYIIIQLDLVKASVFDNFQKRESVVNSEAKERCDDMAVTYVSHSVGGSYNDIKKNTIEFFKTCIVDLFRYEMAASPDDKDRTNFMLFKKLPTFEEDIFREFSPLDIKFGLYAKVIQTFFTKAGTWKRLLSDEFMKSSSGASVDCKNLLYVVGARYAYYTHILWAASDKKIKQCRRDANGKFLLPESVCFPVQTSRLTCTSDADVGIIGKEAGNTVKKYNEYITNLRCGDGSVKTTCTSDSMMDNNIYAYNLQLATPELFDSADAERLGDLKIQKSLLAELDKSTRFQWLDIILATMQLAKQNSSSFFGKFLEIISLTKDEEVGGYSTDILKSVSENNEKDMLKAYHELIGNIQSHLSQTADKERVEESVFSVLQSNIKANESYHSFGALRTIVVAMQMKRKAMVYRLSLNDYIASSIENYGYAYSKIMKCRSTSYVCLAEASKYLWRVYSCLKAAKDILVDIGKGESLSDDAKESIKRARDYLAELYFVFKNNKKEVPSQYFSTQAYKEDVMTDDDGKDGVKPKQYSAMELQKKYMNNCESSVQCMKTIESTILEYTKTMAQYQEASKGKHVVDKTVNSHYFEYVTAADGAIKCYKEFLSGKKDPCGIKG